MARTKSIAYKAPEAPSMGKGGMKKFKVAAGCTIFDSKGKKRKAGEMADLTENYANFFANLNYIVVTLKFNEESNDVSGEAGAATGTVEGNSTETVDEHTAETNGGEPDDGPSEGTTDEPKRGRRVRGKSNTL